MFKYDEPLCRLHEYKIITFSCKSTNYKQYREIIPHKAITKGLCFNCSKYTDMEFSCVTNAETYRDIEYIKTANFYKPDWKCTECNSRRNFMNYDIISYKEVHSISTVYKCYGRYRSTPIPYTRHYSASHSHGGLSNKGLIIASYRKAMDYQVLSYKDDIDETMFIKFTHRKSIRNYEITGASTYDSPHRHRHRRTWKRSKKKHQWE